MKRGLSVVLILLSLTLFVRLECFAQYVTSAEVPSPTGIAPVVTKVLNDGKAVGDWADKTNYSAIAFGKLSTLATYPNPDPTKPPFKVFVQPSPYFFAIDIGYTYSGATTISGFTVAYIDTSAPQPHGLGWKTTCTFMRKFIIAGSEKVEDPTTDTYPGLANNGKLMLKDVTSIPITFTNLGGGWLRLYVGLATLDPDRIRTPIPDPTGTEVFTPGDVPGNYAGRFTISI